MSAAAWLGLPLLLFLIASGLGLAAESVARFPLPEGLHAPVGACVAVLVTLPVVQLDGTASVTAALLVLLALAGFVHHRRGLAERLIPGWAGLAGVLTLALYLAPVVLSGHWTWLGYNLVNDTAVHLAMVDHVAHHGAAAPVGPPSSNHTVVGDALGNGYPLGTYGLLAALSRVVPVDLAALYQPFIACLAALSAMALTSLARRIGVNGPVAASIAFVAAGANLSYQYALHGALKELALVLVVATSGALAREALDARLHIGAVALVGLSLAAGIAVFSAAAGAYVVGLAVVALVALACERARPRLTIVVRAAAVGAVTLGVVLLPVAADTLSFGRQADGAFAEVDGVVAPTVYGHLVRSLPLYQSLGIWFRDDYRYPLESGLPRTATTVFLVLACVLIVVAVVAELRRRRFGALLVVLPALLVYLLAAPRLAPYADAKLLVALSPMAVFSAGIGAWWLSRRATAVGVVAGVVVAGGVLLSDALAYHHARLAPVERLLNLRDAAEHARGDGPVLLPEWEELAKYFAGDLPLNVGPESYSPRPLELRAPGPIFGLSFDLDELTLAYVESWPTLMLRRSPLASEPPANYTRSYRNADYELWRRRSTPRVLEHLSLQSFGQAARQPRCEQVLRLARRAGPGQRLLAAARPILPEFNPAQPPGRPRSWGNAAVPGLLIPQSRARASGRVSVPGGRYRVWVRGGGGRAITAVIDGRDVGARQQVNTPGGWLDLGHADLAPGPHAVVLSWPAASLEPGNGFPGEIGPLVLEPQRRRTLVEVSPKRARAQLCGRAWDWIERVVGKR